MKCSTIMKGIVLITLLTINQLTMAQELKDFRWKNRILITNNSELKEAQLKELKNDSTGSSERKLIFLLSDHEQIKKIWPTSVDILPGNSTMFKDENEVLLIGLDGGVKYRSEKAISKKELFSLIDSMPMRAAEMKKDNE